MAPRTGMLGPCHGPPEGMRVQESTFWDLVERSRTGDPADVDLQSQRLTELLDDLPVEDLVAFDAHFVRANRRLYTYEVMGAGTVMLGWMSSDVFTDFRSWVVGQGRHTYERVLRDPDSLAEVGLEELDAIGVAEVLAHVASQVFERRTGRELCEVHPDRQTAEPSDRPAGEEFEESDDALRRRYPRLAARWLHGEPTTGRTPRILDDVVGDREP